VNELAFCASAAFCCGGGVAHITTGDICTAVCGECNAVAKLFAPACKELGCG
jgi:hypothetical protein